MSHALLTALALFPAFAWLPAEDPPPVEDIHAYRELTNTRRSASNLNIETIRGMAWDADESRLYAVNTHGSTLVFFNASVPPPGVAAPGAIFRTINNPTALALWEDASQRRYAIVVGGSSHGVVKHDRDTGEIVAYLNLPAEPKDIVIDTENNWAWVSCAGAFDEPGTVPQRSGGVVMKIDLGTFAFIGGTPSGSGQHFIDAARPTFLNIEVIEGDAENIVYVAPLLSGNQTTSRVVGPVDSQVVSISGLPDDDLFAINESGTVSVAAKHVGTLITNHGRNPASGKYWILNVDSLNAAVHTEAEHRGGFAVNQITSVNLPQTSPAFQSFFSLDGTGAALPPLAPTGMTAVNKPASFPFGLAIHATGFAALVSSTGDSFRLIDGTNAGGTLVSHRNVLLPEGSIPRGALLSPDGQALWIYAWGTNRILQYDAPVLLLPGTTSVNPLLYDLGVDPQPDAVKHGRRIWYDADNSLDPDNQVAGKVTCNTCHPAGAMDMLGWDLSDPPNDRKDTMVTQSLLSIEDTFPYHWRGERALSDFNGAFQFLLGGAQLDGGDLADFEAFVFSLQGHANPRQSPARKLEDVLNVLHDTQNQVTGVATNGQVIFHEDTGTLAPFATATCVDCHAAESGSNGQITFDVLSGIPGNTNIDVAHLRQLQHKFFQPKYSVTGGGLPANSVRPRGGFGFSQDGGDNDIIEFFGQAVFFTGPTQAQDRADGASFVMQFDEGIAPRAHDGAYFAQNSTTSELSTAADLIAQAQAGNCDLVAIGHYLSGGIPNLELRLWFDAPAGLFRTSEVGTGYAFDVPTMQSLRTNNFLRTVLIGLPLGNAYRFAVDPDDDGLSFLTEAQFTSAFASGSLNPWRADTDGDTYPDGYERGLYLLQTTPVSNWPDPLRTTTPSQVFAADTVVPNLGTSGAVDFVSARQSKHFVTFSEPVKYEIQVEHRISPASFQSMGPPQIRPAWRTFDTLDAHHLQPSFDFVMGTPQSTFKRRDEYRLKITMTDLAGRTNVQFIPPSSGTFFSDDDVMLTQLTGQDAFLTFASHAWTSGSPIAISGGGSRLVLDTNVDDIWEGATVTPPATLAPGRTIVAQILTETSPGSGEFEFPPFPGYSVTVNPGPNPPNSTRFVSTFTIAGQAYGGSVGSGNPIEGPLLLSPKTDSAGIATFDFNVFGIPSGTKVRINMAAVLLESQTALQFELGSIANWQLPMTSPGLRFKDITL